MDKILESTKHEIRDQLFDLSLSIVMEFKKNIVDYMFLYKRSISVPFIDWYNYSREMIIVSKLDCTTIVDAALILNALDMFQSTKKWKILSSLGINKHNSPKDLLIKYAEATYINAIGIVIEQIQLLIETAFNDRFILESSWKEPMTHDTIIVFVDNFFKNIRISDIEWTTQTDNFIRDLQDTDNVIDKDGYIFVY